MDCIFILIAREFGFIIAAASSSTPSLFTVLLSDRETVSAHWVIEMLLCAHNVHFSQFSFE